MFSKKLTETQIRDIARQEARLVVTNAFATLKDNVGSIPQRADGNANARDLYDEIKRVEEDVSLGLCG